MALTSIGTRQTPSAPMELSFGATPNAAGVKIATLFAHRAQTGGTGVDYEDYTVTNVGDPDQAKAEVDLIAGAGSQAGEVAYAFVAGNAKANRSNFPGFRIILLPFGETGFGPADEALMTAKFLRSDLLVSPYPASDTVRRQKLLDLNSLISGADRDLNGQFGSFAVMATFQPLADAVLLAANSRFAMFPYLRDTNTAEVETEGDLALASNTIVNIETTGIYPGALLTGTGIPANTYAGLVSKNSVTMVDKNGNDVVATVAGTEVDIVVGNKTSQTIAEFAAAWAAGLMSFGQPYNPPHQVTIGGIKPPKKRSDWIQIDPNGASEQALRAGLSPVYVQPGQLVGYIATRTTLTVKPDGVTPVTDYVDYQQLVVLNDFKEVCYQITQNPPFNNNPGGAKASERLAGKLKDEVLREADNFEKLGMFQNVKLLSKFFQVEVSRTDRGRFDFRVPVDAIPNLKVIAGNILAVSDAANFTL